jgi:ATP-dependent Clp protease adaptor protein ClpS
MDDFPKLGTATPDIGTEEETATQEELEKPWNVIVHNDPINLMSYVTLVFMRVLGMPREKAERHMTEVHKKGKSIVWSGDRERAEHYVHQLHQAMLLTTMEKSR